jgi:hypothetical protein
MPEDVRWRFHLAVSETMERIGPIQSATDRQVQIVQNRGGGASFTVPVTDPLFEGIEPLKHCIIASRNGVVKWSGPIWTMNETLPANRMPVTCVGWFELLNHRVLRRDVSYPRFTSPQIDITGGGIVFDGPFDDPASDTYYPGGLLTIANAQSPTHITAGPNTDTMRRVISYQRGQNIGAAITDLSDVEAGFDFGIDPLTRLMTIKNWDERVDRSDQVVFGYNWGPNNLNGFGRQLDASTLANRVTAMGTYGGGLAEDLDSQTEYGLFEEITSLSNVVDPNVLLGFAGGEVALRSRPRVIYQVQPFPWIKGRIPQPFVDYDVGDLAKFSAHKGKRIRIENQKVRVFGMQVGITNEGNEKIGALQLTPGG